MILTVPFIPKDSPHKKSDVRFYSFNVLDGTECKKVP